MREKQRACGQIQLERNEKVILQAASNGVDRRLLALKEKAVSRTGSAELRGTEGPGAAVPHRWSRDHTEIHTAVIKPTVIFLTLTPICNRTL